jgi:hypothetical protein
LIFGLNQFLETSPVVRGYAEKTKSRMMRLNENILINFFWNLHQSAEAVQPIKMQKATTTKNIQFEASLNALNIGRFMKPTYSCFPYSLKLKPDARNRKINATIPKNIVVLFFLDKRRLAKAKIVGK